jgi:hypothetical protein
MPRFSPSGGILYNNREIICLIMISRLIVQYPIFKMSLLFDQIVCEREIKFIFHWIVQYYIIKHLSWDSKLWNETLDREESPEPEKKSNNLHSLQCYSPRTKSICCIWLNRRGSDTSSKRTRSFSRVSLSANSVSMYASHRIARSTRSINFLHRNRELAENNKVFLVTSPQEFQLDWEWFRAKQAIEDPSDWCSQQSDRNNCRINSEWPTIINRTNSHDLLSNLRQGD